MNWKEKLLNYNSQIPKFPNKMNLTRVIFNKNFLNLLILTIYVYSDIRT